MPQHQLHRQQSSTSCQFESFNPSEAHYFCCFGFCHSKTVGVLVFLFELIELISSAVFLFLKSASYNTKEWQSTEVLIIVGVTLVGLIALAISTALLFMGVCCEESTLVIPYMLRQVIMILLLVITGFIKMSWAWHIIPIVFVQMGLLVLSFGTYKYFADKEKFNSTTENAYASRNASQRTNNKAKLSQQSHRLSTIDLC
ncbi:unnamed protein product [Bursaphelenchus okinawaensis]|uniref:Uncharacterized protein n=1 Tax=Bursaphelenchus okinawaensis TaxID=465554 RepID=A0A811K6J4_9BILA|nr:unnamed protein product [Bursaphelenchus okinawaensis]CAG9092465.1 unnamed protein product [Bursaphelenchus okinawaensis]